MQLTPDYIAQLRVAMRSDAVRRFVRTRLTQSLTFINIDPACIAAIHGILESLAYRKTVTPESLAAAGEKFQKTWRAHLNRTYFIEYEALRWPYLRDYVLSDVDPNIRLGRCLDIGCGRGWLTTQLVTSDVADSALGIDAAGYESEWKDRLAQCKRHGLEFARVPVGELVDWTQQQAKFDTILMLYVLHHSSEYWAAGVLASYF
jgi:2-polyprenyl-3-methyl-5-hydroxy-6-metoxy-1,4-benzoquinol methylase